MVVPVYISLDPARDTIGQLRHYAKGAFVDCFIFPHFDFLFLYCKRADFHPSVRFLTGTQDQLEKVARAYRVYYMKVIATKLIIDFCVADLIDI